MDHCRLCRKRLIGRESPAEPYLVGTIVDLQRVVPSRLGLYFISLNAEPPSSIVAGSRDLICVFLSRGERELQLNQFAHIEFGLSTACPRLDLHGLPRFRG